MDISAALVADLAALTEALGDPSVDLEAELRQLAAGLTRAVASFTGLTMTVGVDGQELSFSAAAGVDGVAPATSLKISLPADAARGETSLIIYAAVPGAFVDLAADLSYILDIDLESVALDEHPPPAPRDGEGMTGLNDLSMINQAIGVLLARGHTRDSAVEELRRLAELDGGLLRSGADAVLRTLASAGIDTGPDESPDDESAQ